MGQKKRVLIRYSQQDQQPDVTALVPTLWSCGCCDESQWDFSMEAPVYSINERQKTMDFLHLGRETGNLLLSWKERKQTNKNNIYSVKMSCKGSYILTLTLRSINMPFQGQDKYQITSPSDGLPPFNM